MRSDVEIILVRGAPGVGKTTIGKLFRKSTPGGVVIDVDDVRRMVADETFEYSENVDYCKSVTATCALAESFLDMGYAPIVVVDVFSPPILDLFRRICAPRKLAVITLYSEDMVLARRMARRSSGYINCEVAIKVNRLMKRPCECSDAWVDTSSLCPAEVFAEIARQLERIAENGKGEP